MCVIHEKCEWSLSVATPVRQLFFILLTPIMRKLLVFLSWVVLVCASELLGSWSGTGMIDPGFSQGYIEIKPAAGQLSTYGGGTLYTQEIALTKRRECKCPSQMIRHWVGDQRWDKPFFECLDCRLPEGSPTVQIRGNHERTCFLEKGKDEECHHWGEQRSERCPMCNVPYADMVLGSRLVNGTVCVCKVVMGV